MDKEDLRYYKMHAERAKELTGVYADLYVFTYEQVATLLEKYGYGTPTSVPDNSDYDERTLIKLRRQYSKDETVAALNKKLTEAQIEIGKMKAEVDHLEAERQLYFSDEQKEIIRLGKIEARKNELYQMQVHECRRLREQVKQLTRHRDDLIARCAALQKKIK